MLDCCPKVFRVYWGSLLGAAAILGNAGCVSEPRSGWEPGDAVWQRFQFTQPQMGVPFRIVLYAPDQTTAESAAADAYKRIKELNAIFTDYDTDSELNVLSQTAGKGFDVPVSPDLWRVLERSQTLARQTEGAFDITIGPVVSVWRKARYEKKMPDPARLAERRAAVGHDKLVLDPKRRTARLLVPFMHLDLGGIAKGYAVDAALAILRDRGIRRALVAGSGDIAVGDPPPGKIGWRVEVAPLDVTNAPAARFVLLANRAIATSGDVFQHVEIEGRRYSHIVDPRTGVGLTDHSLVSIIAHDCTTADSLATAVSVLGPERGLRLAKQAGVAVRIVRWPETGLEMYETREFKRFYDLSTAP